MDTQHNLSIATFAALISVSQAFLIPVRRIYPISDSRISLHSVKNYSQNGANQQTTCNHAGYFILWGKYDF